MSQVAVVTGAGSGVGRAVAIKLAMAGWSVVLVGRKKKPLEETQQLASGSEGNCALFECDLASLAEVTQMADWTLGQYNRVDALVNSAGTNVPKRSLEVLSIEDYNRILDTNLNGAYFCVRAFLPTMRAQRSGTIINIVSDAAKAASPKAGPAYVMSKFGMLGLTQSINAEERQNGIRACAILPGDIDTPLLEKRPAPPNSEARTRMLQPEDVAECAWLALSLPPRAIIEELLVRPRG